MAEGSTQELRDPAMAQAQRLDGSQENLPFDLRPAEKKLVLKVLKRAPHELSDDDNELSITQKKRKSIPSTRASGGGELSITQKNLKSTQSTRPGDKLLQALTERITVENMIQVHNPHFVNGKLSLNGHMLEPGKGRFYGGWTKVIEAAIPCGGAIFTHCLWAFECQGDDGIRLNYKGRKFEKVSMSQAIGSAFIGTKRSFTIDGKYYMVYEMLVEVDL